jgi:acetyl esterase/lipase
MKKPLVVVCPGGGYSYLSDREAEPIALSYAAAGYHAVVLNYGINEHAVMPGPLKDIAMAVAYIREHAEEWHVDSDSIFVSGFSAGAHVAASLSVFWNNNELLPEYEGSHQLIKPNGLIVAYPVLDLKSSSKHLDIGIKPGIAMDDINFGQRHPKMPQEKYFIFDKKENRYFVDFEVAMNAYIFGGEYTDEQENFYSLQNHVSKDTPPTFIWHTAMDGLILPSNSLLFASALQANDVPFELHIYGTGDHGLSLGNYITANYPHEDVPAVTGWFDLATAWLNRITGYPNHTA